MIPERYKPQLMQFTTDGKETYYFDPFHILMFSTKVNTGEQLDLTLWVLMAHEQEPMELCKTFEDKKQGMEYVEELKKIVQELI